MMRTTRETMSSSLKKLLGVVALFSMFPLFGQSSSALQCMEEGYIGNEFIECQAELNAGNPYPPDENQSVWESVVEWVTQPFPKFTHTSNSCELGVTICTIDVCEGCVTCTVLTESVTTCEDDRTNPISPEDDEGRKKRR